MRLIAAIADPSVARRILECLSFSSRAPPLVLASEFDREPVISRRGYEPTLAEADGDPGFDFDQTLSEDRAPDDAF